MKLRVLGSAGAEFPGFRPPAFLINDDLLLDGGTIGAVLTEQEQAALRYILLTHSHLDHLRGIPALADNHIIRDVDHTIAVYGLAPVIDALGTHLFNDTIWPDFTRLPTQDKPVLTFIRLDAGQKYAIANYSVRAVPVNHTVPACAFIVSDGSASIAYTGDTGPTEALWREIPGIDALIVEVSFPNAMEPLALMTKHLTASLLHTELKKISELPKRIFITHPKPQYVSQIAEELATLGLNNLELLHDGAEFTL